jgi:AbrB family looped-hinge helix DNA binding protein
MPIAQSKLTAQGQVSVPAKIREKLGLRPGSVLDWDEEGGKIVVSRSARYTSEDVHRALFPKSPKPKTLEELKEGPAKYVKEQHARGRY